MPYLSQSLVTVWKVTKRTKRGEILDTIQTGEIWVSTDLDLDTADANGVAKAHGGDFLGFLSTARMKQLGYSGCHRRVSVTTSS